MIIMEIRCIRNTTQLLTSRTLVVDNINSHYLPQFKPFNLDYSSISISILNPPLVAQAIRVSPRFRMQGTCEPTRSQSNFV